MVTILEEFMKKSCIILLVLLTGYIIFLFPHVSIGNTNVEFDNIISSLQVVADIQNPKTNGDIDGNGKTEIVDAIYGLQILAQLKPYYLSSMLIPQGGLIGPDLSLATNGIANYIIIR